MTSWTSSHGSILDWGRRKSRKEGSLKNVEMGDSEAEVFLFIFFSKEYLKKKKKHVELVLKYLFNTPYFLILIPTQRLDEGRKQKDGRYQNLETRSATWGDKLSQTCSSSSSCVSCHRHIHP